MRPEDEWANVNVGLFPIDARGETYGPNAPAPSMKKLTLTCRSYVKPKTKATPVAASYFPAANQGAGANAAGAPAAAGGPNLIAGGGNNP